MYKITRKNRLVKVAAATAAIGSIAAIGFAGNSPAQADPLQYTSPLFGFGSDTLQDVTNAFAGYSNNTSFKPVVTDNGRVMVSWDAYAPGAPGTAANCITTKTGTGQMLRPNGSTAGLRALSATAGGGLWPATGTSCGGPRAMTGIVDFARSSSAPTAPDASGPLQYIPAFKDALGFAYVKPTNVGAAQTSLTVEQLRNLHVVGPQLIGGTAVIACGIQTSSGTYGTWMNNIGAPTVTTGTRDEGTNACNALGLPAGTAAINGRLQESNSPDLLTQGGQLSSLSLDICDGIVDTNLAPCTNAQLIVGYSASQFIARGNGVGTPNSSLASQNGGFGLVDGRQAVTGTAPNLTAVSAAYDDATFGRTVYYVVPFNKVSGNSASPALQDMFVTDANGPAKFCTAAEPGKAAGSTILQHGFLEIATCGVLSSANRANLVS